MVAGYRQRYCGKNDTIGFFGPLGWERFLDDGPAIGVRAGALQAERVVHLETWAVEALARAVGDDALLPMDPFPERALRARLAGNAEGLAALDRLEAARAAVTAAALMFSRPHWTSSIASSSTSSRRRPRDPRGLALVVRARLRSRGRRPGPCSRRPRRADRTAAR